MAMADYASKVPDEVQQANSEKLGVSKGELQRLVRAMASLRTMV